MDIRLEGVEALRAKIEAVRADLAGPAMAKALRAGGTVMRDAMVAAAPVLDKRTVKSTALPPGALRDGMRVSVQRAAQPITALIGPKQNVQHVARWLEFGHRMVHGGQSKVRPDGKVVGRGVVSGYVAAHPFIRRAFESSLTATGEAIVTSLRASLKKLVG